MKLSRLKLTAEVISIRLFRVCVSSCVNFWNSSEVFWRSSSFLRCFGQCDIETDNGSIDFGRTLILMGIFVGYNSLGKSPETRD